LAGILIGLGVGIGWFFGFGPGRQPLFFRENQANSITFILPEINQLAPDFELQSIEGTQSQLSSFKGKTVLINFWATWCIPCREEMPLLEEFADRYSQDMVVLGINAGEKQDVIQEYVDSLAVTFPILVDSAGTIASLYRVRGFPTTMLIDENGVLRFQHIGVLTEPQLIDYLAKTGVEIK
jgi:cytochrome c biogenesis protein CcmG, thiol:disulfide interchange protein DsbE